ncbi:hypothetical protein [Leptospira andrefontaineae]|uniref:Uncharacterized protein n=1 Tax=Leptospira andrefontaineae TaxID=2484976 RepID=A0A4R9H6P3_9LEPT|nr:hypothetical protein [Leptospira andrefontaineae]TGK41270.1 hypothetical protein EHO65_07535 [Leptospira andrefontaineae]
MNKKAKIILSIIFIFGLFSFVTCEDGKEDSTIQSLLMVNILTAQPNDLSVQVQGNCGTCANFDLRIYEGSGCSGSAIQTQLSIDPSTATYTFADLPGGLTYSLQFTDGTDTECDNFYVNGSGHASYCGVYYSSTFFSGISCI